MTNQNVKAFIEALSQDESIQKALKEKEMAYTGIKEDRETFMEAVVIPLAKEVGYEFTLKDLKDFEKGMRPQGELDEDELESVAGGTTWGLCVLGGIGGGGESCFIIGFTICVVAGF